MALDPNLARWIYASATKHINARLLGPSPDFVPKITFFEGLDKDTNPKTGAEFRMDGPRYIKQHGFWEIWIAINILIQTTMDNNEFHKKHQLAGEIAEALDTSIPVYRYGDNPDTDDKSFVGCLTVIHDKFNRIQVNHFGQVDSKIRLEQGTIEAHYHMDLSEV